MPTPNADIGMIGLAVMGQNLVLNMDDNGYSVAVYNRTASVTREFIAGPAAGTRVSGHEDLPSLIAALKRPRKVMLMVKAGAVVDAAIEELKPLLEPGDLDHRRRQLQPYRFDPTFQGAEGGGVALRR